MRFTVWKREIRHNERYLSDIKRPIHLVEGFLDLKHVSVAGKRVWSRANHLRRIAWATINEEKLAVRRTSPAIECEFGDHTPHNDLRNRTKKGR